MELFEYWRLIVKRKTVIAVAFCSVFFLSLIYILFATPVYEAGCKLLITDDSSASLLGDFAASDMMVQSLGKADPISTQIEVIKTRPILEKIIEQAGLRKNETTLLKPESLKEQLGIQAVRNTNIITITYRNPDPALAASVLNLLAEEFVEKNQELNRQNITAAKEFIGNQLAGAKEKLIRNEQAVLIFKNRWKTVALEKETEAQVTRLVAIDAAKMQLQSKLTGAEAQLADLQEKIGAPGAASSPLYAFWVRSLEETSTTMLDLRAQEEKLESQIAELNAILRQLPPKEIELARLLREEKIANEIYVNLSSRYEEVKINEASQISNIKIIEPAVIPEKPVFPQKRKFLLLSAVAGLALGFGLALLYEYLDDTPDSVDTIREILPYPVLGNLPLYKGDAPLFAREDPRSPVINALRLLVTHLKHSGVHRKKHSTIMVTSALPGEGKTTVTANLAAMLASQVKNVAVVNLDLRKPAFRKVFDLPFTSGVADYLNGQATLEEIMYVEKHSGVTVIPEGTPAADPGGLLTTDTLLRFIEQLKARFDLILIDSAPATIAAETLEIAQHIDKLIVITDIGSTSVYALRHLQESLSANNLPVTGIVVNKVSSVTAGFQHTSYQHMYY